MMPLDDAALLCFVVACGLVLGGPLAALCVAVGMAACWLVERR